MANWNKVCFFDRERQTGVTFDLKLKNDAKVRFMIYAEDIKSAPKDIFLTELAEKPLQDAL